MISTAPLKKLLAERGISTKLLSQITGIEEQVLNRVYNGKNVTQEILNTLCSVLKVQPCDIIEYIPSEKKGHWVYVEGK